jgi:[NiFe] hydrogenase assembly HybE family chaperone
MVEPAASVSPAPSPARAVERAFGLAAERMRELPICNPALHVEVVGLRAWQEAWLGVVVTPWTVSLLLLPREGRSVRRLGPDERQRWRFPSGEYDFQGGEDPALGPYQTCSLLSPPFELASQEDARLAARAALEALLAPSREEAGASGSSALLSRRGFLGGARRGSR